MAGGNAVSLDLSQLVTASQQITKALNGLQQTIASLVLTGSVETLNANAAQITGSPSISFAPTANTPTTLGSLVVQATTAAALERQFLGAFGLTSNSGYGTSGADKVALYAATEGEANSSNIWALNTLTQMDSTFPAESIAQGYELDFNNNQGDRGSTEGPDGMGGYWAYGLAISGASSYTSSAGIVVAGATAEQWYRGVVVTGSSVFSAFSDYSAASVGLEMVGSHGVGIDMNGSTLTTAIRIPNNAPISAENAAGTGQVQCFTVDTSDSMAVGSGAASVAFANNNDVIAINDNALSLGINDHRWTAVWAVNGTIQTSDATLKTNIKLLPDALPIIAAINPVTFNWITGGYEQEAVTETQTIQDEETVTATVDDVQMVDGKAVLGTRKVSIRRPAFDMVPVFDAKGAPVMHEIAAQPARLDKNGKVLTAAVPARQVQRMHRMPRMVTKQVTTNKPVARSGKRTHWGFLARDILAATPKGMDWGAYVKATDGSEHMRPDQLIPVLWKAVQELQAQCQSQASQIVVFQAAVTSLAAEIAALKGTK